MSEGIFSTCGFYKDRIVLETTHLWIIAHDTDILCEHIIGDGVGEFRDKSSVPTAA